MGLAERHPEGVTRVSPKWRATFRYGGNRHWLGAFPSRREAALACWTERRRLGLPAPRGGSLCIHKQGGHWVARISVNGRRVHLGKYETAAEAEAADEAALARKRHGALQDDVNG